MASPTDRPLPTQKQLLDFPGEPFLQRDLSWLQFNDRVLKEAEETTTPLLERAKFLAISASNLDEFFMIRFASLNRSIRAHFRKNRFGRGRELQRVREQIVKRVGQMTGEQKTALGKLADELVTQKLHLFTRGKHDDKAAQFAKKLFNEQILGQLDPQSRKTLRQIGDLGNLATAVVFGEEDAWFPVPRTLAPAYWVKDPGSEKYYLFFLDDLLLAHLGSAFSMKSAPGVVRLTRDGDFSVDLEEDDTESIPDAVRSSIGTRDKGRPVRVQYLGHLPPATIERFVSVMHLDRDLFIPAPQTVCLQGFWSVVNQLPEEFTANPKLTYPPIKPMMPSAFKKRESIFDILKARDLLLHHPYDSFDAFVKWIQRACEDPSVSTIELTVYRTDAVSPVINALKKSARSKTIRVVIELRARFDELNNLRLAEELRQAGIDVAFGFGKLKLHAKIALVTRMEGGRPFWYTHLSTGNYNAVTARQYTDIAILTANQDIGKDARLFFDSVWKGEVPVSFRKLVSAPARLRRRILNLIEAETRAAKEGRKARVVAKVNALVDEAVIEALYQASQAGVQVDLIVRGACSLIPGVKDLSENIRVISIVDRFLEHSRIYYFESSSVMYLSSADWMPRNFFSRLEIAFPVLDPRLFRFLESVVIPTYMGDTAKARELMSSGLWRARVSDKPDGGLRSQFYLEGLAAKGYAGTPLSEA